MNTKAIRTNIPTKETIIDKNILNAFFIEPL